MDFSKELNDLNALLNEGKAEEEINLLLADSIGSSDIEFKNSNISSYLMLSKDNDLENDSESFEYLTDDLLDDEELNESISTFCSFFEGKNEEEIIQILQENKELYDDVDYLLEGYLFDDEDDDEVYLAESIFLERSAVKRRHIIRNKFRNVGSTVKDVASKTGTAIGKGLLTAVNPVAYAKGIGKGVASAHDTIKYGDNKETARAIRSTMKLAMSDAKDRAAANGRFLTRKEKSEIKGRYKSQLKALQADNKKSAEIEKADKAEKKLEKIEGRKSKVSAELQSKYQDAVNNREIKKYEARKEKNKVAADLANEKAQEKIDAKLAKRNEKAVSSVENGKKYRNMSQEDKEKVISNIQASNELKAKKTLEAKKKSIAEKKDAKDKKIYVRSFKKAGDREKQNKIISDANEKIEKYDKKVQSTGVDPSKLRGELDQIKRKKSREELEKEYAEDIEAGKKSREPASSVSSEEPLFGPGEAPYVRVAREVPESGRMKSFRDVAKEFEAEGKAKSATTDEERAANQKSTKETLSKILPDRKNVTNIHNGDKIGKGGVKVSDNHAAVQVNNGDGTYKQTNTDNRDQQINKATVTQKAEKEPIVRKARDPEVSPTEVSQVNKDNSGSQVSSSKVTAEPGAAININQKNIKSDEKKEEITKKPEGSITNTADKEKN